MKHGARCSPPRSQGVKSHVRGVGRRRKRTKRRIPDSYWVAENEHGKRCSHHHRSFTAAVACARRTQRAMRAKYGRRSTMGGTWLAERKGKR